MLRASLLAPAVALLVRFAAAATLPPPPPTSSEVVRDTLHGTVLEDPYRWLEDQKSPATRAWIDAENAYTDQVMKAAPGFDRIHARLEKMMRVESMGVPRHRAGFYFYTRRRIDQTNRRRGGRLQGPSALVDPHSMSPDHPASVGTSTSTTTPDLATPSARGRTTEIASAISGRKGLSERFPVSLLRDLDRAQRIGRLLHEADPEATTRPAPIVGTDPARDRVVFGATGPR
jgi:prolyl oligopeptidase